MYKPNYIISDELLSKIAEIESYRTKVDASYILPEREVELRYRATVEATHSSTSIEGNPLNMKQTERVLGSNEQLTRHQYAEIEVRNYKRALDFVSKRKGLVQSIEADDVLKIHKLVMDGLLPAEKVGCWRKKLVFIENQDGEVVYTGPEARLVRREIEGLLEWLNREMEEIHPVIAAAILHFQFVSIHPFADGNGRTTRLLVALLLGMLDYDFRGCLVLDSYYAADKLDYYRALNLAENYMGRKTADLETWLDYFVSGFLSAAKILSAEVAILASVVTPVEKQRMSRGDADILSYAKQFGSVTLAEAKEMVKNASERTVQRRLRRLVEEGYLVMSGNARDTRYVWREK